MNMDGWMYTMNVWIYGWVDRTIDKSLDKTLDGKNNKQINDK